MAPRCSSGIEYKKKGVTTLVKYCEAYRMVHKQSGAKIHLFILSAFQKDTRDFWQTASRDAQASTSGIEIGSKIYVAFLSQPV